ncbi:nuclease [Chlorobaculum limnaeum]|uniref:Nuclease n=1 Tax=Chlorobaculum limnaeum TaxID=274537 RepID=A0A1D8D7H8_CHLLM|nr:NERD domain-containing protein [Chlorobaculum limnaeum]AOS83569.1 nuclease [Chlorobaculum limnaeum]
MDFSTLINEVFKLWWLITLMLILGILKSPWFKGVFGETLVKFRAKVSLPAETYHAIHNVTLPTLDGSTQIDHIFVSPFGIFVVETKNIRGWIFGAENQAQWTQQIFKQSFKFQNPLRQNYKHVKALQATLNVPASTIHSVVAFVGDSTFKTPMPPNVTCCGRYIGYIKSFHEPVLSESEVQSALVQIQSGRLETTRKTNRKHVQKLQARSDPSADRKCPKCGSAMVLRTAKRGANMGKKFLGCSAFPKCRVVQNIK